METSEGIESLEEMRELAIACFKRGGEDDEEAIMWYRMWYGKRQEEEDRFPDPVQSILFAIERAKLFYQAGIMEQARQECDEALCEARNLGDPNYFYPIEDFMLKHGWEPQLQFAR